MYYLLVDLLEYLYLSGGLPPVGDLCWPACPGRSSAPSGLAPALAGLAPGHGGLAPAQGGRVVVVLEAGLELGLGQGRHACRQQEHLQTGRSERVRGRLGRSLLSQTISRFSDQEVRGHQTRLPPQLKIQDKGPITVAHRPPPGVSAIAPLCRHPRPQLSSGDPVQTLGPVTLLGFCVSPRILCLGTLSILGTY